MATEALDGLSPDALLWNLLGKPSDSAPAYASLLRYLETFAKKAAGIDTVSVALVKSPDGYSQELASAVVARLRFNGSDTTVAQNQVAMKYKEWSIDSKTPEQVGNEIVEFRPDIIISVAGPAFTQATTGVLPTVMANWGALRRPYFLLSPLNASTFKTDVLRWANDTFGADAYQHFVGIEPAGAEDLSLYNEYLRRMRSAFPRVSPEENENFYDAIWYLAYAIAGAGTDWPLTGLGIGDGMRRLIKGPGSTTYSVGPSDIPYVLDVLDTPGAAIRLMGADGPPDFSATFTRKSTGAVYCFDSARTPLEQVLRYDLQKGDFTVSSPASRGSSRLARGFDHGCPGGDHCASAPARRLPRGGNLRRMRRAGLDRGPW